MDLDLGAGEATENLVGVDERGVGGRLLAVEDDVELRLEGAALATDPGLAAGLDEEVLGLEGQGLVLEDPLAWGRGQ